MPKRRLFRRRENGEWIKQNAYAAVTLLSIAGGAVAWAALFDRERPQAVNAPADLVAEATPTAVTAHEPLPARANESSTAAETTLPLSTANATMPAAATVTKPAHASTGAAPRAAGVMREANRARTRQWSINAKSRALAPSSRHLRLSLAATAVERDHTRVRLLRVSASHRTHASITRARVSAHDDALDRAYSASPVAAKASTQESMLPLRIAQSSSTADIEPAVAPAACTHLFHAFGATRRIPSDC